MKTTECNRRSDIFDICEQICEHTQEYQNVYNNKQQSQLIFIVMQLTGLAMNICDSATYTLPDIPENKE